MNQSWELLLIYRSWSEIFLHDTLPCHSVTVESTEVHQYPTWFHPMASPIDPNRTFIEGVEVMLVTSWNQAIDGIVHLASWDAVSEIKRVVH